MRGYMPEVYVIVADSARARVLHTTSRTSPLMETDVLAHPEGRMHTRDLTSDLPGRDTDRSGLGRHRMDSATDPKQYELVGFAREISAYLEKLLVRNKVDQLMIVAPPAFLGALREHLPQNVATAVTFELGKNLTRYKPDKIRSHLPYFKPVERLMT